MTLADLLPQLADLNDHDAKQLALVFGDDTNAVLLAAQEHRESQHRVAPIQMIDGRWLLCADLLTEIRPGGLWAGALDQLPADLLPQVEVMPWADAVALLPQAAAQPPVNGEQP